MSETASPPPADDENRRLAALRQYRLLDTLPEQALDDLTSLASQICGTPISLITLVDAERQWFKSKLGVSVSEIPRDASFSTLAIAQRDLFIVPDASQDLRFAQSPVVTGPSHIRFYAGAPLITPTGEALGVLCVMDRLPRQLDAAQQEALSALARQAMAQLELRKQARELLESESRLRIVTDNARVGLVVVDRAHRYVYANGAYADILGLSSADIVGRLVREVLPDVYERQIAPRLVRAFAGERVDYELHRPAGDGDRYYSVTYDPTEAADASLVVVVITEVTQQRLAQAASSRLSTIVEFSTDAIIGLDLAGAVTSWNKGAEAIFGYGAAEMVGGPVLRLIPADRRDEEDQIVNRIRRDQPIKHFETVRLTKDGTTIDVAVTASPIKDAAGALVGYSKVIRDITDRKQAMAALQAAEERIRFALLNAGVGIWDIDFTTMAVRWSDIMEAQYGLPAGTFEGTIAAFYERIHPDDRQSIIDTIEEATKSGDDFLLEHRSIRPDGSVRWLRGSGRISRSADGKPLRGVGISQDVTARRSLEEQYHQAQKMQAIGRLAGGVAHDFNNLLTAILGYCELLLPEFEAADPRRHDIEQIERAGTSAAALTRQLLAFSRKQIIELRLLDLNTVLTSVRPMLRRLIGEDITVVMSLRAPSAVVKGDAGQLEQIVLNLALNARDAMPKGGTLTIETACVDLDEQYARSHFAVTPGPYVALTVTDTGIGMTPGVQARLFEPFFTTKEIGRGTGLGLATVHGIVARSGGNIAVYSEVNKGTSFTVYLPRAEAAEVVSVPSPMPRPAAASQTILVVEDEDGLRELARRLLQRQGFAVLVAANAAEALRLFEQNRSIDVLLTDVVMPGESGPELSRRLLALRSTLNVIYMSGYTEDAILQHGVLKPGTAFLHKPFTSETLNAKIREVLDR